MALSVYAVTGGPDKGVVAEIPANADYETIAQVMDRLTERYDQRVYKLRALQRGIPQDGLDTDADADCNCDAEDNCRVDPNRD